jgi:putative FmdB family regulatory protein
MPLYEYQCTACEQRFERIQKFSDPPVDTCPSCGGKVRKLLSSPAIQFKGSGWYITDYARAGSKDDKKGGDKPAAGGSEAKSETPAKADTSSTASTSPDKSSSPATKSE